MIAEHDREATPGLPGALPPGERILWQGSPDRRALARSAFHTRAVAGYFVLLVGVALASALAGGGPLIGAAMTAIVGILGVALLQLLAWASARSTIYTLTDRRIVLRIGIALPTSINLPLKLVGAVDLNRHADGTGDVALTILGVQKVGYAALWPHARPWRLAEPQPMLRAVPGAAEVAALLARTCQAANPQEVTAPVARPAPAFGEAIAA